MISIAGAFPADSCFLCLLSLTLHSKTRVLPPVPAKDNVPESRFLVLLATDTNIMLVKNVCVCGELI